MIQKEIDFLKIVGTNEESNPFIEKMTKFFLSKKGNLFSFLKTLPDNDLKKLSDCFEKENEKWQKISIHLSTMAYSFEQTQYGNQFEISIEEIININKAFIVCCALALQEKHDMINVKDESFFFVYNGRLEIRLNDQFFKFGDP